MHISYHAKLFYVQFLPYILPTTTLIGLYSGALEIDYMDKYKMPITDNKFLKTIFVMIISFVMFGFSRARIFRDYFLL